MNKRLPDIAERISKRKVRSYSHSQSAAARAISRKSLAIPKVSEEESQKLGRDAHPVAQWIDDGGLSCVNGSGMSVTEIYKRFRVMCQRMNHSQSKQASSAENLETILVIPELVIGDVRKERFCAR